MVQRIGNEKFMCKGTLLLPYPPPPRTALFKLFTWSRCSADTSGSSPTADGLWYALVRCWRGGPLPRWYLNTQCSRSREGPTDQRKWRCLHFSNLACKTVLKPLTYSHLHLTVSGMWFSIRYKHAETNVFYFDCFFSTTIGSHWIMSQDLIHPTPST
jgi:hypothetical protein